MNGNRFLLYFSLGMVRCFGFVFVGGVYDWFIVLLRAFYSVVLQNALFFAYRLLAGVGWFLD